MNYEANRGYFNGYDGYGSGFNFTYAYDSNIGQEGVPQSRNADPYAEECPTNFTQHPRNYQVDAGSYGLGYSEANTKHWHHDTDINGDTVSRQRPRSRTSSNRNNRSAGRPDRPTIQPEQIPVPSSTYLRLAEQPSVRLTDSTQTRKLLILDLNGTLLYREPRTKDGYDPYALNEPRPLRPTHTRPYMSSFKAFLFHPETRKWLDTMVWSSAQYPNVKDMISRCFGEEEVQGYAEHVESLADGTESHREGLVALWDRKFLGLSETQYRNKFQTTKNLAKPWALLPLSTFSGPTKMLSEAWDRVENDDVDIETASKSSGVNSRSRLTDTSFLDSLLEENHLTRNELLSHSAHSTLLLDDSPLKARMQPYNHVCVPEYEGKFYARDVRIAEARDADAFSDDIAVAVERTVTSSSENVASAGVGKRKRSQSLSPQLLPRNHKKMKRLSPEYDADDLSQQHDHILLAVIGLLEALKHESNVAAWIKDNGLFASNRTESEYIKPTLLEGDPEAARIVKGHDTELDSLYRNSVPEGVNGVALTAKKKKKERWRNTRHSGRDSGISALSLGPGSSWTDGSMSLSESVDLGHGNDIGVRNAQIKNEDNEIYPSQSQHTEPASRPNTPDSKDTLNYSGATTQPPSPPNTRLRRELARKRHLLPRQERRDVPQSLPSTPNFIDSIYLYGKNEDTSDRLKAEPSPKRSSLDCMEHVDYTEESNPGEKDIFSNPRASPPGLTGKGLDIDLSTGLENPPVEHSAIESAVAQISKSQIPFQPLPSLWYQHPPARWYWVRRGVRVLKELGLEVIPGVEINLD